MENLKYSNNKNENNADKYLNSSRRSRFLKVKDNLLELENDFISLKDGELKDRELKIKKGIEALFFKQIIVSIDDMDKFEQKKGRQMTY